MIFNNFNDMVQFVGNGYAVFESEASKNNVVKGENWFCLGTDYVEELYVEFSKNNGKYVWDGDIRYRDLKTGDTYFNNMLH